MLRTTIKGLIAHKARLFTTALAVVLGVAFMSGTLVLTDSLGRQLETLSADTYAQTDVYVRSAETFTVDMELVRGPVDADLLDEVVATEGIEAAIGRTEGWAQIVGADGEPLGGGTTDAPNLGGNWITVEQLNPFELAEGEPPAVDDEVVIDRKSATEASLAVGDRTTVLTAGGPIEVTISGIAMFGTSDSMLGMSSVLFTDAAAQELVGEPGRYAGIAAVAAEGADPAAISESLGGELGGDVAVLTGEELRDDARAEATQSLAFFNAFLMTFAVIALFVGAFIISNTFSVIVAQRTRELAVLRAIGASRRQVMGSVVIESGVVGVVASLVGLVAGLAVALGLREMLRVLGVEIPGRWSRARAPVHAGGVRRRRGDHRRLGPAAGTARRPDRPDRCAAGHRGGRLGRIPGAHPRRFAHLPGRCRHARCRSRRSVRVTDRTRGRRGSGAVPRRVRTRTGARTSGRPLARLPRAALPGNARSPRR